MTSVDVLEGAQLLHERAQHHIADYSRLNSVDGGLWQLRSVRGGDGISTGTLFLDRTVLRKMKPVISDIANNLIHALDHVAASAGRATMSNRMRDLYFPIALDDSGFEAKLRSLGKLLEPPWLVLFSELRAAHKSYVSHLWLLKQISNQAKHWELVAGGVGALTLAWTLPGDRQQTVVQIPRDHEWRLVMFPAISTRQKKNGTPRSSGRCSVDSRWQLCSKLVPNRCRSRSMSCLHASAASRKRRYGISKAPAA